MVMNHFEIVRMVQAGMAILIRESDRFCLKDLKEAGASKIGSGFIYRINNPIYFLFLWEIIGAKLTTQAGEQDLKCFLPK